MANVSEMTLGTTPNQPSEDLSLYDLGVGPEGPAGVDRQPTGLLQSLLTGGHPLVRAGAARGLVAELAHPAVLAAVLNAAHNDPDDSVRASARQTIQDGLAAGVPLTGALIQAAGGSRGPAGCHLLGNIFICVSISVMDVFNRDERIEAVTDRIRTAVAELPDVEEQREAEIRALVTSVPKGDPYPEQLKAFTGMTHTLRVLMARQLEPKFRDYLLSSEPKPNPNDKSQEERNRVITAKATFADQRTDELSRLGLAISLDDAERPCYIRGVRKKALPWGGYSIIPRGGSEKPVDISNWSANAPNVPTRNIPNAVRVLLLDAATPGTINTLNPGGGGRIGK